MDYSRTLDWMFAQLPMYQRQGASAYKIDLSNTLQLAEHLGNPHKKIKTIHVAGTNGKGSTSHMLAAILQEAGYRVGLYTSPHLKDFRERIRINGAVITEAYVVDFIAQHRAFFDQHACSFFEMTVGMAFQYFADQQVDIAVIEVGLGGRLDSTNIIRPEVSVITNIGMDHTQFLGTTFAAIAAEKAGIIKQHVPVVIGRTIPETKAVFEEKAAEQSSPVFYAADLITSVFKTDLLGQYQQENIKTAVQTIHVLQGQGWEISEEAVEVGLQHVVHHTGLLGRWQVLQTHPKVVCDTAHNEDGLASVMQQVRSETHQQLHIVLGVVADKDLDTILPLFPIEAVYYFCAPTIKRALAKDTLQAAAANHHLKGSVYNSVKEAYTDALANANAEDLIYIGGSTFVVAEII